MTKILKIESKEQIEYIRQVSRVLNSGGLVAIPTETVYGIGAIADQEVLGRLDRVKGRPDNKRYSLHIGNLDQINKYVPGLKLPYRKAIIELLPGPITIVFSLDSELVEMQREKLGKEIADILYRDNTIGVRYPELDVTRAILSNTEMPVVMPSANPLNQPPATDINTVIKYFPSELDLIVDGGLKACNYKESSTVVKIGTNGIELLRKGVVSEEKIRKAAMVQLLFVCTGNTCRSPMAEGICKKILSEKLDCGIDELEKVVYKIVSAGAAAFEGMPASTEAVEVCRQLGISIADHRSQPLNKELIEKSDFIYAMSPAHIDACTGFGARTNQVKMLDEEKPVSDPIGRGIDVYQDCADQMKRVIEKRMSEFL